MIKKLPNVSWSWEEGRFLDLWAFVHLTSGLIIGVLLVFLNFPFEIALITAMALLILGEVAERFVGINESFENGLMDIVVGAMGFFIATYIVVQISPIQKIAFLILSFIASGVLNYLGWKAHKERQRKISP